MAVQEIHVPDIGGFKDVAIVDSVLTPAQIRAFAEQDTESPDYPSAANFKGHWPMLDSDIGTLNVTDVQGPNDLEFNNIDATAWVQDVPDPLFEVRTDSELAVVFDGVDDSVNIPYDNLWNGLTERTTCYWFKANSLHFGRCFGAGTGGTGRWYLNVEADGTMSFQIATNVKQIVPTGYSVGVWTHVAITYDELDSQKVVCYVNGVQDDTWTAAAVLTNSIRPTIGAHEWGAGSWFDGLIDGVQCFGRELSAQEVAQVYANEFDKRDHGNGHWNKLETGPVADFSKNKNLGYWTGTADRSSNDRDHGGATTRILE